MNETKYEQLLLDLEGADLEKMDKIFKEIEQTCGRISYYGSRLEKYKKKYLEEQNETKI